MAKLQVEIEGKVTGLKSALSEANGSLLKVGTNVDALQAKFNSLSSGIIGSLQNRLSQLKTNLENATDIKSISKYNIRIQETQNEIERLKNLGLQAGNSVNNIVPPSAVNGVNRLTNSFGNANGVALEFNRIIQDAPFGMIGMGNNIQQLVGNWQAYVASARAAAAQTGTTVTTMQLLRAAMGAIISPINLLTLGISVATSAWTFYTMWSQRASKANKEAADTTEKLAVTLRDLTNILNMSIFERAQKIREATVKTLRTYEKATMDAGAAALAESQELKRLYTATQDQNRSLTERTKLVKYLKSEYPEYLKNFSNEEILAGKAADAYDRLSTSIQNTAKARVLSDVLGENLRKEYENLQIISKLRKENAADQVRINKSVQAGLQGGVKFEGQIRRVIEDNIKLRNEQLETLEKQNKSIGVDNKKLESDINGLLGTRLDITRRVYKEDNKSVAAAQDYLDRVKEIAQNSQFSLDIAESRGLDELLEKNKQKYKGFLDDLDALEKQTINGKNVANRAETLNEIARVRTQIARNQALEEQQIRIKFEQDTQDNITKILNDAGISRVKSRQQELDASKNYFNELENQYRNNAAVLQAITEARKLAEAAINEKFDAKAFEGVKKMYDKIEKLENKPFAKNLRGEELKKAIADRLAAIEDIYKKIDETLKSLGVKDTSAIMGGIKQSFDTVTSKAPNPRENDEEALNKRLSRVVESGFRQGLGNLFDDIDDLGSNFYEVFSNTFDKLAGNLTRTFQNLIATELGNVFSKILQGKDGKGFQIAGLSEGVSKGVVAGLGVAGGLVSSMTGKTNTGGQIAGGILTGVAAGSILGPLGMIGGGILGGISGFFSSKAAKKQQELQEKQLAEQRKQTALLAYQNALSYASNIIGQRTVDGIVTAVDRNATGQLIATISGKDIKVILDRNGGAR